METQTHNQTLVAWDAPSFIPSYRGHTWMLIAGTLALSLIAYAIFTGSATMAIVFILLAGMFFLTHNEAPKTVHIEIKELGIQANETFYPYNMIKDFWIVYNPPLVRTLNFRMANRSGNRITLQLWEQDPAQVREALAKQLTENKGVQENLVDILIRLFKLQ